MCGRCGVYADGSHVRERFGLAELPGEYEPRYNAAPLSRSSSSGSTPRAAAPLG